MLTPRAIPVAVSTALFMVVTPTSIQAEEEPFDEELCMMCHAEMEGETHPFPDGSTIDLFVDQTTWEASVHKAEMSCDGCHVAIDDYPHPERDEPDARAYQLTLSQSCNRCHYAYFTRILDSMHYAQLEEGNRDAPTCVDCHGAHETVEHNGDRAWIDRRCRTCHEAVSDAYRESVHGHALIDSGNQDVPVCTDCHGAHEIADPNRAGFHTGSHEVCAQCHGDAALMAEYDLNPYVIETYLDDFHGTSNAVLFQEGRDPTEPLASCVDCHGVHDIQPMGHAEEARERVIPRCRACHGEVDENFAAAWLSHYQPTLESAPLVWMVKAFYGFIIPFMVVGLLLHIALHLWRAARERMEVRHG